MMKKVIFYVQYAVVLEMQSVDIYRQNQHEKAAGGVH
jgi:hypothetical protein